MENIFKNSEWIWSNSVWGENEYAEFSQPLTYRGGEAKVRISICGDYVLYVNGKYVSSNQYADFEHYKVYDEISVTKELNNGENTICILAWYFGKTGMRYSTPTPGVIYEIVEDDTVIAASGKDTLSRKSLGYQSGGEKKITPQMGYSFCYDATCEDNWLCGGNAGFSCSHVLEKTRTFYKRPTKKLFIGELVKGEITQKDGKYIIDLGKEIVGMPVISLESESVQKINIAYGEILENGHVKRIIGNRDFSFEYITKSGENNYTNYMFRIAARYLEIECDEPITLRLCGVLPQNYAVREKDFPLASKLDKDIYEICMETLRLCMMEHYVDCPWREQCLYVFDSRNQMRVGYIAFEDGNFEYARANLLLMSKDIREDGLMSICFPSAEDLVIPSFSIYYALAVKEYMEASGDLSLGKEVISKIESVIEVFLANRKNGLVCQFNGGNFWNFYDWSPYANFIPGENENGPDFLLNCIIVICLKAYDDICKMIGHENKFAGISEEITRNAKEKFYSEENGLFFIADKNEEPTELANSLAVVSGIAGSAAEKICSHLAEGKLVPCSLSMRTFKYDAMLSVDRDRYAPVILDEIRGTYKIMLDSGSTTVWETIDGAEAFDNAGSLCHGWSSIPVYYFDLLKGNM